MEMKYASFPSLRSAGNMTFGDLHTLPMPCLTVQAREGVNLQPRATALQGWLMAQAKVQHDEELFQAAKDMRLSGESDGQLAQNALPLERFAHLPLGEWGKEAPAFQFFAIAAASPIRNAYPALWQAFHILGSENAVKAFLTAAAGEKQTARFLDSARYCKTDPDLREAEGWITTPELSAPLLEQMMNEWVRYAAEVCPAAFGV